MNHSHALRESTAVLDPAEIAVRYDQAAADAQRRSDEAYKDGELQMAEDLAFEYQHARREARRIRRGAS